MPAAKAARKLAQRQMTRATLNLRNTLDFSHANVEQRRASGQRRPPARSEGILLLPYFLNGWCGFILFKLLFGHSMFLFC